MEVIPNRRGFTVSQSCHTATSQYYSRVILTRNTLHDCRHCLSQPRARECSRERCRVKHSPLTRYPPCLAADRLSGPPGPPGGLPPPAAACSSRPRVPGGPRCAHQPTGARRRRTQPAHAVRRRWARPVRGPRVAAGTAWAFTRPRSFARP